MVLLILMDKDTKIDEYNNMFKWKILRIKHSIQQYNQEIESNYL